MDIWKTHLATDKKKFHNIVRSILLTFEEQVSHELWSQCTRNQFGKEMYIGEGII